VKIEIETSMADQLWSKLKVWQDYVGKNSQGSAAVVMDREGNKIIIDITFFGENVLTRRLIKRELNKKIKEIDNRAKMRDIK
jgi:hypothetical protein